MWPARCQSLRLLLMLSREIPTRLPDLLLRQLDVEADPLRRALAERLGEPQQAARDPRGRLEEERVLEVLARLPLALAQHREEAGGDLGVRGQEREEAAPLEHQEIGLRE